MDQHFPICRLYLEDITHSFWCCNSARQLWKSTEIEPKFSGFTRGSIGDLFQWIMENGNRKEFELFVLICSSIWTERNHHVFQGKIWSCVDVVAKAKQTGDLYRLLVTLDTCKKTQPNPNPKWQKPPAGVIKIKFIYICYYIFVLLWGGASW